MKLLDWSNHNFINVLILLMLEMILFTTVNATFSEFLKKSIDLYSTCSYFPALEYDHDIINKTFNDSLIRAWRNDLGHEAYWLFRACPIYFSMSEGELNEFSYWEYAKKFIDNDPQANVYMCEPLESIHKLEIIKILRSWMILDNDTKINRSIILCIDNPRSEFIRLLDNYGFLSIPSSLCKYSN